MKLIIFSIAYILMTIILTEVFAHSYHKKYYPESDPQVRDKINRWQDLKFGLLMHWGPYCQWGVVESWSICAEDEPWCTRRNPNYNEYKQEYENLKTTFNPINFDPEKWALAAKNAGMRYVVFTTKHHDGFCMFDSQYTDYKITDKNCPFHTHPHANITAAIFDAFRQQGLWIGAYFSKPDWHNEYYWWPNFATPDRNVNYDIQKHPDRWQKFVEFTHNQILELMSDYGPIDILWLDGGWVQVLSQEEIQTAINLPDFKFTRIQSQDIKMAELVKNAREKQPGLIVVDRAVEGPFQNYLTPENQVPERMLPYPWESCIIAGGGWSYVPNARYKSTRELIHLLIDIVSKGGNLLLNIAPGPDGSWHPEAYDRLSEIGDWLKINAEAIYNTRPIAPYKEGKVCLTQQKDGSTYAIYLADRDEKNPPSRIWLSTIQPETDSKVMMLGTNENLRWKKVGKGFIVDIPESIQIHPPCQIAWTVKFFVKI